MPSKTRRKITPRQSPEAHARQLSIWRHNSFIGHARMMQTQAKAIITAPTVSVAAAEIAQHILIMAGKLEAELRKERIDPK